MKFLILNGPNLNMLGIREPEKYGTVSYDGLVEYIRENAEKLGVETDFFQSNSEGDIVTAIQKAYKVYDGIIINPAAYTHTSIAILDALKAVDILAAEVHITDIAKREPFRQISYAGLACKYHFIGQGIEGYINAIKALAEEINNRK